MTLHPKNHPEGSFPYEKLGTLLPLLTRKQDAQLTLWTEKPGKKPQWGGGATHSTAQEGCSTQDFQARPLDIFDLGLSVLL